MLSTALHGTGGLSARVFLLAVVVASGCSSAKHHPPPGSAELPQPTVETDYDDAPMRPASGVLEANESSEGRPPKQQKGVGSTTGGDATRRPGCSVHAETTPRGIALVFSARTSTVEQVRTQVMALASELQASRAEPSDETQAGPPSSFGTRQIAKLAAHSFVSETTDGARLAIEADDSVEPEQLRARVLWHMASFLPDSRDDSGLCPVIPRAASERRQRAGSRELARKPEAGSRRP